MQPENGFPALLRKALLASGLTQRDLAKRCGFSPGLPPFLLSGQRTPPPEKIPLLVAVLGLSGEDAEVFTHAAWLAHAPVEVAELVDSLRQTIGQLQQQHAHILGQRALILQQLQRLGFQDPQDTQSPSKTT